MFNTIKHCLVLYFFHQEQKPQYDNSRKQLNEKRLNFGSIDLSFNYLLFPI